ncbi:Glycosyltransferase involved in cell wall bisynthesis [Thiohalospira halophila DSM 15071]|uniref:Glycosyltransferase involved in cell wall bisynthesis n=1 Tax=Thiohalospira halophila DSM 15071 TaxID=1123397 RepID=A0A1I1NHI3_9GAMM|nr:glycosyltransferase family 4 protein [Thiohalospira halophila]SFC96732.1 Glycosyltransferase involved in cell wall bisynthesis [Thiohalospira halophila DSM 15071]
MSARLLFVVNAHEFTAAHRLPLLRGAQAAGFKVEVVAPGGSPAAERLEGEGFVTHPVRLSRQGLRVWEEWGALRELTRLYRRLAPDLVHHATIKPVLYGTLAARRAGRPAVVNAITGLGYVYTGTDWRSRLLRHGVDALYRRALHYSPQRIIFQNRDDWAVLQDIGAVDPEQAVLIPGSGVDVATFTPAPEAEGPPVVVLPARLIRDKGVDEFVAAARALHAHGVEARFALVGGLDTGNPAGITEAEVRGWVEEGIVEWWGQVDDMRTVYEAAHVVVLPSYREGLPKVALEAGATGRPVITTDAPGCRDAVVDGETGYLVPVRDSVALAERIGDLLADPALRQRMGSAGRERVVHEFSTEKVVADTLAVYRQLLSS